MVLAEAEGETRLWLRRLDQATAQPLPGTDGAMQPFWSPDSQFVGFFTFENKMKKIAVGDGTSKRSAMSSPWPSTAALGAEMA